MRNGICWGLAAILSAFAWVGPGAGPIVAASTPGAAEKKEADRDAKPSQHHSPEKQPSAAEEVLDSTHWQFFESLGLKLQLPRIAGFQITKFMILEVIAAALVMVIYIPMARRLQHGDPPKGWRDNAFEVLLTFIREEVARPNLERDTDKFVPFLWTLFLFILFCNLLGLIPFAGSPTANIYMTGALAICVFFAIHGGAVAKMGFLHYLNSLWPHIEVPFLVGIWLKPMIFVIEVVGVLVRNGVLAVRLFANMFSGHMVLGTILLFIIMAGKVLFGLWASITLTSILGIVALSLLEIFVAFLQAYIFVFLAAVYMGLAMHPQH